MYDLVVIGGGVVGLAVLRAATLQGWKCALVEAESDLLGQASGSNSGIACTGVDATPGTLERALIRDANAQFRGYCQAHNLPTRPCGSLVCLWPWDQEDRLPEVLAESHHAGDTHATQWTPQEVAQAEPNLASSCRGAVHIPGEIVIDPWLYSISLAVHARENGADIFTNFCVDASACQFANGVWTIPSKSDASANANANVNVKVNVNVNAPTTKQPAEVRARCVVNAAGIFADLVQDQVHGTNQKRWTAKPRRGQYRVYNAAPNTAITHPIQPVPSQFTKGIFVFSTVYDQLVVGPTALDQDSRTDRRIDEKVADHLDTIVQRILPGLVDPSSALVGEYVGIRPGTDQRDYQIHLLPQKQWVAVAGIRSTGLTASLGIGDYVVRLLLGTSVLEGPPSASLHAPSPPSSSSHFSQPRILTTPLPPVADLIRDFQQRGDGRVVLLGHTYKVTHPLTRFGWSSLSACEFGRRSKL